MATLLTATPSHIQLLKAPGQTTEIWVLSYNVPDGDVQKLSHGQRFAQVSSPRPHQIGSFWKLTQFEVRARYFADQDKTERSYIQKKDGQRLLTDDEITHVQNLIEQFRKDMMNHASPKSPEEPTPESAAAETCASGAEAHAPDLDQSADGFSSAGELATGAWGHLGIQVERETTR